MKVLLLSAYSAHSHVHWARCLQTMFKSWQWRVLNLPPRYFSWRVRGNALYWSVEERTVLEEGYDLLIATSMVDLATLRGLVPALTHVPSILYFHENQFEYPQTERQHNLLEIQLTSIYAALAADRILFNSNYNQQTFMAGCAKLLRNMPDRVPPDIVPGLQDKAEVIPVPIDLDKSRTVLTRWPSAEPDNPLRATRLLWVGRFEYDKGAQGLLRILYHLENSGLDYELAMTGQQFRQMPPVFSEIKNTYGHRLVQFGYVEELSVYHGLLQAADIVLSTALHEFQGLAVMDAVAHNCLPIVPDRLVYPEIYPTSLRYDTYPDDPEKEAIAGAALISKVVRNLKGKGVTIPDLSAFSMDRLTPLYEQVFRSTVNARDSQ
jgi:glycosyltransferase involved in cell wall biosynthesis